MFGASVPGHFLAFPAAPGGFGKTEAERLVYALAIAAWLLLPLAVFWSDAQARANEGSQYGAYAYAAAAAALGFYAWRVLRIEIIVEPNYPRE